MNQAARSPKIVECGPTAPPEPRAPRFFELQDALLLAGVASLVGGIGMLSIPAALIALGMLFLFFVWLIDAANRGSKGRS